MSKGGQPKGERRGGRKPGVPNRTTLERIERAQMEMTDAKQPGMPGRKLAKDRLEEIMDLAAGVAMKYAPVRNAKDSHGNIRRDNEGNPIVVDNVNVDMAHFHNFMRLWFDAAKALASFQSPQLRAITVVPPAPELGKQVRTIRMSIFDSHGEHMRDAEMMLPDRKNGRSTE